MGAGARSHSLTNPEEVNRIFTDHVSTLLLSSTQSGMEGLEKENLADRGIMVGDLMYDAFFEYSARISPEEVTLKILRGETQKLPQEYYYLTCHREENMNDDNNLLEISTAMQQLDACAIYPVHPRNKERALRLDEKYYFKNVLLVEPVGYIESICMVNHGIKIVTDSGGLQREAFLLKRSVLQF